MNTITAKLTTVKAVSIREVKKFPEFYTTLSQIDPVRAPSRFLKIHFNIISHLRLGLPCGLFPSVFPTNILYAPLLSPVYATRPSHLIILALAASITFGEKYGS
jgi:hypothetical protein